jgi:hypothetical protein
MRKHLAELAIYVKKGKAHRTLEEFDFGFGTLDYELLGQVCRVLGGDHHSGWCG